MIRTLAISEEKNLKKFINILLQENVMFKVTFENGFQIIWGERQTDSNKIIELYNRYKTNQIVYSEKQFNVKRISYNRGVDFKKVPLVCIVLILSIVISLLVFVYPTMFNFFSFESLNNGMNFQLWRLFTPIFIHFGILHISMNLLWYWEIGKKIETYQGTIILLLVTLITGGVSNMMQFFFSKTIYFGGLSGVIYGLLGYCVLYDKIASKSIFKIPKVLVGFMIFWLVICFSGFTKYIGLGDVANTAHLTGLIVGFFCAIAIYSGRKLIKR